MGDDATASRLDPSSPYYLSAGDQPGNLITHMILNGENYVAWSRAFSLSLKARQKFVFIDGTLRKPTDAARVLDWDTNNSMIVSWMLRSMESNVAASIPFHDVARTLWQYLEKRFSEANSPRLQQLRTSITNCKQAKTMSVDEYFTTLMGLYDELNRLKPLYNCTCGNCTCNVAARYKADQNEEQLHQFLIGIDDEIYATVCSNLLSQTPLPDLARAHQAFLQEERSRSIARGKSIVSAVEVLAFALQAERVKGKHDKAEKARLTCTHCRQKGHDVTMCFKLIGYPEWWEECNRNKTRTGGRSQPSTSSVAGSRGAGNGARAHAVTSLAGPPAIAPDSSSTGNGYHPLEDLTREQVDALLNIIKAETRTTDRMSGPTLEERDWSR
ncbi:unnamed protein product [Cuscuta epithymum]|uniref:Retrotransposon Copia-like N-terminal domain-containing protein n=1 Tax=Cuscuta epithymum TaxID=186058 RepID=A0AAV0C850_9ASTE|nr:unnamed protein product [Cuscuta epithymum]